MTIHIYIRMMTCGGISTNNVVVDEDDEYDENDEGEDDNDDDGYRQANMK